jgi:hypothetical protein
MTSWPSPKTDLSNAGATWVLAFCRKMIDEFAEGRQNEPQVKTPCGCSAREQGINGRPRADPPGAGRNLVTALGQRE